MRTNFIKSGFLILTLVLFIFVSESNSQDRDNERRFSLSINGGVTFASASAGGRFDGGFDVASKTLPMFGLGLQYSITPYWSIEGVGYYHKFENKNSNDPSYKNQVLSFSFRNVVHLNQLFETTRIWNNVSPYGLAGFGTIMNDIDNFDNFGVSAVVGAGVGFKLGDNSNLFLQYEYTMAGNLDNSSMNRTKGSDHFGLVTAGIRFHLGKGHTPRSWRQPSFYLSESDYNALMALNSRMDNVERQVSNQASEISNLSGRVDGLDTRVSANEAKIADLEAKYADLHAKVRDLEENVAKGSRTHDGLTQVLPDGFYVQVFAANSLAHAQRVRSNVANMVSDPVLITKRGNFYEVRVGVYERFPAAANTLRALQSTYSDAFVVKFPRPAHLRDAYSSIAPVE